MADSIVGQKNDYITFDEFDILASFIYRKSGIRLDKNKAYFMNNRVYKRIKELKYKNIEDYIRFLKFSDTNSKELQLLINQITINETYFFRDFPQLESFVDCLKETVRNKMKTGEYTLKIWSAACSTGEEPYTLALILNEILDNINHWRIDISATDIDHQVISKAKQAKYDERSIKDVPPEYLKKYFIKILDSYQVIDTIKKMVSIEYLNLMDKDKMRLKCNYDFIFCRNVLIYFDDDSRRKTVEHLYSALNPGGYIFLGSSESMGRITNAFTLKRLNKYLVYCKE